LGKDSDNNLGLDQGAAIAIAAMTEKLNFAAETIGKVDREVGSLSRRIDEKFTLFGERMAAQETKSKTLTFEFNKLDKQVSELPGKSLAYEVVDLKKEVKDLPKKFIEALDAHEQKCPSREVTIRRLQTASVAPKSREVKSDVSQKMAYFSNGYVLPKWVVLVPTAIAIFIVAVAWAGAYFFGWFSN